MQYRASLLGRCLLHRSAWSVAKRSTLATSNFAACLRCPSVAAVGLGRTMSKSLSSGAPAQREKDEVRLRTAFARELSNLEEGTEVILSGWHSQERTFKDFVFSFLRDGTGYVQVVWESGVGVPKVSPETIIQVKGIVRRRAEDQVNTQTMNGAIEIVAKETIVINHAAAELPLSPNLFYVGSKEARTANLPSEETRLRYRYLDLRREEQRDRLRARARAQRSVRKYFDSKGFTEVETPILFKSTPEGAKEFLVPALSLSGKKEGKEDEQHAPRFYALPQSPQQYKQLLMASGMERYYQLARCFRDEASRADRQPEFTQVDMEMSFASREQVMNLMTGAFVSIAHSLGRANAVNGLGDIEALLAQEREQEREPQRRQMEGVDDTPFAHLSSDVSSLRVMSFEQVMAHYGIDKPDLRIPLPTLQSVTEAVAKWESKGPLWEACQGPGVLDGQTPLVSSSFSRYRSGIVAVVGPRLGDVSRSELDKLKKEVGLGTGDDNNVYAVHGNVMKRGEWKGALAKHLSIGEKEAFEDEIGATEGDLFFLLSSKKLEDAQTMAGRLRYAFASLLEHKGRLSAPSSSALEALWVVDFPLFRLAEEDGIAAAEGRKWEPSHHPFTSPTDADTPAFLRALGSSLGPHWREFDAETATDIKRREQVMTWLREGAESENSDGFSVDQQIECLSSQHYDLVVNGCELGGGSVRLYDPFLQSAVFHILGLSKRGDSFRHLLSALSHGCPPHAGMAFGFDRTMSIILGTRSIRDVIPFPKASSGVDPMTGAPSVANEEALKALKDILM